MRIRRLVIAGVFLVAATSEAGAQSGMANVGDATLYYEVIGQGVPVVLIHGWALSLRAWDDQARAFAPRYRVVRYDLRGFGRSTGFADVTADPADLAALLDHLDVPSAYVIGHSRGAGVALAFALAFPQRVRGLVLYGPGPLPGFGLPWDGADRMPDVRAIARQFGLDSVWATLARHPLTWEPPQRAVATRARVDAILRANSGRDLLEDHPPSNRVPLARIDQLRRIDVPTLVVTGDHEMPYLQVVAAAVTYGITGAKHVTIADGGHGLHFAQPERFNAAVLSFLDDLTRTTVRR